MVDRQREPPRQGTLIGDGVLPDRFRVRQPLGRGAHGRVYLAWDSLHERDVALKLLELGGMEGQAALHEARALARVRHPNVVTVYELVHRVDPPVLVMEYVEGEELEHRLSAEAAPLDPGFVLRVGRSVAAALVASHAAGVLHRDIKPSNVLVADDDRVKLIDFGVARRPLHGGDEPPAVPVGTPLYLAPELLDGGEADERADIYAVGVMLYRALVRRYPFAAEDLSALRRCHAEGKPPPDVRELRPDVPASLAEVIRRCLAPREERLASAAVLLRELEQAKQTGSRPLPALPYVGLAALTDAERGVFFGREEEAARVLGRLRVCPAVALVGTSGAGKSSLALAGVCPAVQAGGLGGDLEWQVRCICPGREPLGELARVLGGDPDAVLEQLRDEPGRWWRLVRGKRRGAPAPGLLLVVDQLEELVTLCGDVEERRRFGLALRGSLAAGPAVRVLITVRDDFVARLGEVEGLAEVLETIHIVRPLDGEGLRAAVVEPARAFGYSFEDRAMVERIVDELAGRSGTMPLLGFAMRLLWEERDEEHRLIPRVALERVGGIGAALARAADSAIAALRDRGLLDAARRVLLELVTPQGTKRTRTHDELVGAAGQADAGRRVVELLRSARLVSGSAGALELAHEALIREWALLGTWIEESRTQRELAADAEHAARSWVARGRPAELLWRGRALTEAAALLTAGAVTLEPAALSFLQASRRHEQRRRWTRRLALGALAAVLVAGGGIYLRGVIRERDLARRQAQAERRAAGAHQARLRAEHRQARAVKERQQLLEAWIKSRQQLLADLDRAGDSPLRQHILRRLTREGPPPVRLAPPPAAAGKVEVCLFGPAHDLSMEGDWPQKTGPVARLLTGQGYRIGCQYPYVRQAFPAATRHGVIQHAGKLGPGRLARLTAALRARFPRIVVRKLPPRRLFRTVDVLLPDRAPRTDGLVDKGGPR